MYLAGVLFIITAYLYTIGKCLIWDLSFSSSLLVSGSVGFKESENCVTFTDPSKHCDQERKSCKTKHCKGAEDQIQQIYEAVQGYLLQFIFFDTPATIYWRKKVLRIIKRHLILAKLHIIFNDIFNVNSIPFCEIINFFCLKFWKIKKSIQIVMYTCYL